MKFWYVEVDGAFNFVHIDKTGKTKPGKIAERMFIDMDGEPDGLPTEIRMVEIQDVYNKRTVSVDFASPLPKKIQGMEIHTIRPIEINEVRWEEE
jgi:hypothetical protein